MIPVHAPECGGRIGGDHAGEGMKLKADGVGGERAA
jgi:hypothetical protein